MTKHGQPESYGDFAGLFQEANSLRTPEAYFAFIEANDRFIVAGAWKGNLDHGQRPRCLWQESRGVPREVLWRQFLATNKGRSLSPNACGRGQCRQRRPTGERSQPTGALPRAFGAVRPSVPAVAMPLATFVSSTKGMAAITICLIV